MSMEFKNFRAEITGMDEDDVMSLLHEMEEHLTYDVDHETYYTGAYEATGIIFHNEAAFLWAREIMKGWNA